MSNVMNKRTVGKGTIEYIKQQHLPQGQLYFSLEHLNSLMIDKKLPSSEYTLSDIGELSGLSRERIRQIESSDIKKLKVIMSNPKFRSVRDDLIHYMRCNGLVDHQTSGDIHHMMQEISTALKMTNGTSK